MMNEFSKVFNQFNQFIRTMKFVPISKLFFLPQEEQTCEKVTIQNVTYR